MKPIIEVRGISKRYKLGQIQGYKTIRESLSNLFRPPKTLSPTSKYLPFDGGGKVGVKAGEGAESRDFIWALKDVSFDVQPGEVIGIIGRNGSGKSTLLKILTRITEPTEGTARIRGRVASLLEVGTGFHPELTGRENVYLNGAILGMRKIDIDKKFDEIIAFAEVDRFVDTPVKRYSSGMYVRLAFAVAAHLEPEILLIDEVLAVGDASFQKKCLGKMSDVAKGGRTILFVSHNMGAVQNLCGIVYLLDRGKIVASGNARNIINQYLQTTGETESALLSVRKDRQGNGNLRFVAFSVSDGIQVNNTAVCGTPASFIINYQGVSPLRNVRISIAFYTLLGEGVLYLSNELVGKSLDNLPPDGSFICSFEKLPLLPGTYAVNLYCTANGILADWVIDAARINVVEGDYFGTGKLPPKGYGAIVVPHKWEILQS